MEKTLAKILIISSFIIPGILTGYSFYKECVKSADKKPRYSFLLFMLFTLGINWYCGIDKKVLSF